MHLIDHKHYPISYDEVLKAREVVKRFLQPTPLIRYENLSALLNAELFVKHENHNPTGSFKVRGGVNLMHHLQQSGVEGVITFSTGPRFTLNSFCGRSWALASCLMAGFMASRSSLV